MISVPDRLLTEVDTMLAGEKESRSQFIRDAMRLYMEDRKRKAMRDRLRRGYEEMAAINLALAEEGLPADVDSIELSTLRTERE